MVRSRAGQTGAPIHPAPRRNRNELSHAGSRWRLGRHVVRAGLQTDAGPVAHRVAAPGNPTGGRFRFSETIRSGSNHEGDDTHDDEHDQCADSIGRCGAARMDIARPGGMGAGRSHPHRRPSLLHGGGRRCHRRRLRRTPLSASVPVHQQPACAPRIRGHQPIGARVHGRGIQPTARAPARGFAARRDGADAQVPGRCRLSGLARREHADDRRRPLQGEGARRGRRLRQRCARPRGRTGPSVQCDQE